MAERFMQYLVDRVKVNPSYRSILEEGLKGDIEIRKDDTTDMQLISIMKIAGVVDYSDENDKSQFYVLTKEGIETAKLWKTEEKNRNQATAYTLMNAEIGFKEEAMKNIRKVENVKEACHVYGVYDGIVRTEADDIDKLKEAVTWKVRKADNVRSTSTMIISTDKRGNPIGFKKDPKTWKLVYDNIPDKFF